MDIDRKAVAPPPIDVAMDIDDVAMNTIEHRLTPIWTSIEFQGSSRGSARIKIAFERINSKVAPESGRDKVVPWWTKLRLWISTALR